MLYHHDSTRTYAEAASDAARAARAKLEATIENGRAHALAVIAKVDSEVPDDRIVRGPALNFEDTAQGLMVTIPRVRPPQDGPRPANSEYDAPVAMSVHPNALAQLVERGPAAMPMKYVRELQESQWGRELLADSLARIYANSEERYLARSYGGQLRGFLSSSYRRLDSRPLLDSFAQAVAKVGAVPIEGYVTDTRVTLKALMPQVYEPVPGEVVALGLAWGNSDYGNGAHSLRIFMLRLWCTNYAIGDESLRQIHLGASLGEDMNYSDRTYRLDTARSASMIRDTVDMTLGPDGVYRALEAVKQANEDKVDPKQVGAYLKKRLGAGMATQVADAFSSADVEMMPPGQTRWRLSNAISWVAGQTADTESKLDLMRAAGEVLGKDAKPEGK